MKSCEVGMGIHNPLSKDNIMLHFPPNKLNVMYIGVCNWGEVECLQEVSPLLYGFTKEQDATNTKNMCWWVVIELFFVYNKLEITNSPQ